MPHVSFLYTTDTQKNRVTQLFTDNKITNNHKLGGLKKNVL